MSFTMSTMSNAAYAEKIRKLTTGTREEQACVLRETVLEQMSPDIKTIYDSAPMQKLIEDFKRLPDAKSKEDRLRTCYFWTLQYPTSHYTSDRDNEEDLEFVLQGANTLYPIVVPCKRSLFGIENVTMSPYIIGRFLQAFVGEEGQKLLEWDVSNLEQLKPADLFDMEAVGKTGKLSEADNKAFGEAIMAHLPDGCIPQGMHGFMRKREGVHPSELPIKHVVRPLRIVCRDTRLWHALYLQAAVVGIDIEVIIADDMRSAFYVPGPSSGGKTTDRKDVTFCAKMACGVLSDKLRRCSACMTASYCSVLHQKQDWPVHKAVCKDSQAAFKANKERESGFHIPTFYNMGNSLSIVA